MSSATYYMTADVVREVKNDIVGQQLNVPHDELLVRSNHQILQQGIETSHWHWNGRSTMQ